MTWPCIPRREQNGAFPLLLGALVCSLAFALGLTSSMGVEADDEQGVVTILFTYGSEKQGWIEDVTRTFNADATQKLANGKRIKVEAQALGSGEAIEELLDGRRQAHLTSPASGAFLKLGNAAWRVRLKKEGRPEQDLVGPTKSLVRSPLVIAMWERMAKALGWPDKPIGWADVLNLTRNDHAWEDLGHAVWDPFRFGHTHPELSDSGLLSIVAEISTTPAVRKEDNLTLADVNKPETGRFLESVEQAIVFYGDSTGSFARKMFAGGPQYLSAAVLYENLVVESYDRQRFKKSPFSDVVAIYPKEGTFMADHPVGIVQREWVHEAEREAAQKYIQYLLEPAQQAKAMTYGLRPSLKDIALAAPLDKDHGVNPQEPRKQLQVSPPEVLQAVLDLWRKHRKQTSFILVLDTSGSMVNDDRLTNAKLGVKEFASRLGKRDLFSIIPFSTEVAAPKDQLRMTQDRESVNRFLDKLLARGETALYDAIAAAYELSQNDDHTKMIPAVIVLTDGLNNRVGGKKAVGAKGQKALGDLLEKIQPGLDKRPVRIFTIGYSLDPRDKEEKEALEALRKIATITEGKSFEATPETIEEVFREIRTYH